MARQSQAGLVVATCRGDSPLTLTTPASATLEAPWILPRQGSLGALVAMVPAEFGSNKREANRRWGWGGGLWGGKTEAREKERGVPECYGNLKINPVVQKESKKVCLNKDILMH